MENNCNIEDMEHEDPDSVVDEHLNDSYGPDSSISDDVIDELSGIIYISRIPPYMGLSKLRSYFSNFGKVGKIYAHPESIGEYRKRVKLGGNKRLKFTHGWVQFHDKKVAKNVAKMLNNQPVLDKKRHSFWREDLWNIKYLPKFKWKHLVEYWSNNKRERKEKLHSVLTKERKLNYHYLDQLELEKKEYHIENKKKMKSIKNKENNKEDNKEDRDKRKGRNENENNNDKDKVKEENKKINDEPNNKRKTNKNKMNKKKTKTFKESKGKSEVPMDLLNSIVL